MEFNFRDSFQSYSNVELLKIIDQADKYQPEAVDIARQILSGRDVHDSDFEQMNSYKAAVAIRQEEKAAGKEEISGFLESIVRPDEGLNIAKWINVLLVILGINYLWILSRTFRRMNVYLQCAHCSLSTAEFISIAYPVLLIPVAAYLLYKKKRWGWILLLAYFIAELIQHLGNIGVYLYYYKKTAVYYPLSITSVVIVLTAKAGLVLFLLRSVVLDYFGITPRAKRDTLTISISIALTLYIATVI